MKEKQYLSSGEFAKLTGINKRTLHYYNDIDLFKPDYNSEKGYHYYTVFQFAKLELILVLRKMGLSLDEIKTYFNYHDNKQYMEILEEKKQMIDTYIKQLTEIKQFLNHKINQERLCLEASHGMIRVIELPAKKMILSPKISGRYDHHDFNIAAKFSKQLKERYQLYDHFGSRIDIKNIQCGNFNDYDCYYGYCLDDEKAYDEIREKGLYIEAFCVGNWDLLPALYQQILDYAQINHVVLVGYAYEEGINEMTLDSMDDYITRILIKVEKNRS